MAYNISRFEQRLKKNENKIYMKLDITVTLTLYKTPKKKFRLGGDESYNVSAKYE